jgi:hypothetical protein
MEAKKNGIIGKPVIVRANVAGVHAGIVEAFDPAAHTSYAERRLQAVEVLHP